MIDATATEPPPEDRWDDDGGRLAAAPPRGTYKVGDRYYSTLYGARSAARHDKPADRRRRVDAWCHHTTAEGLARRRS